MTAARAQDGPHQGQPILAAGRPVAEAGAAVILVHGRGGSAADILGLAAEIDRPDLAYLAPQAAGGSWYPLSFLAPLDRNQPGLGSGLALLDGLVRRLDERGVPPERVLVAGFSQGACLTLEMVARYPRRYGGVAGLTGGLLGPPGTRWDTPGSLAGTPVFLGAGDPDPHVPWARVAESAETLRRMGAEVVLRRYPGLPHTIHRDEIAELRRLADGLAAPAAPAPG